MGAGSPALSIDEAAALEAGHKLQPYSSSPTVEALTVRGQEARVGGGCHAVRALG